MDADNVIPNKTALLNWMTSLYPARKLQLSDIGQLLSGRPRSAVERSEEGRDPTWFELTWDLIDLILLGTPEGNTTSPDQKALAELIREYFLGKQRGTYPDFFEPRRRWSPSPFTRDEALRGIQWLLWRQEQTESGGYGVFVSGDSPFEQKPVRTGVNPFADVTLKLASRSFDIHFVYLDPDVVGPTDASDSAQAFQREASARNLGARIFLHPIDPAQPVRHPIDGQGIARWSTEFVLPSARYAYVHMDERSQDNADELPDLYLTRTTVDRSGNAWIPYAELQTPDETRRFQSWLHIFDIVAPGLIS